MKFTKPENGKITRTFDTYDEAKEFYGSGLGVIPILTKEEWNKTPADYKDIINGKKYLLHWTSKGTTFSECIVLD